VALSIVATAGAADANSFVLLTEAETYMEGRGNKALWAAASEGDKNIALVEATRDIDALDVKYTGYRTDDTQALAWPRQWAVDLSNPVNSYFDTDEIPTALKNATCELAFQYIKAGTTDVAALDTKTNVKRKKVDVLETEYFSSTETRTGLARYPRVMGWLRPLLENSGPTARVVRN
jgi:hypothetical protein